MVDTDSSTPIAAQAFVSSRVFDAPRRFVWDAWTDYEHLAQWWAPPDHIMLSCQLDLRPAGLCQYEIRTPHGLQWRGKLVYREIQALHQLCFVAVHSDQTRHAGMTDASWPREILHTLTLAEQEGRTTMTLHAAPLNATEEECRTFEAGFDALRHGYDAAWNRLAAHLDDELEMAWTGAAG